MAENTASQNRFDHEAFRVALTTMRKNAGLTQQDIADAISVSPKTYSKWEIGETIPYCTMLPAIADALGCTTDLLFWQSEDLLRSNVGGGRCSTSSLNLQKLPRRGLKKCGVSDCSHAVR